MKTITYTNYLIESKIINKGNYYILAIIKIWIPDDKTERNWEETIIEFGKAFSEISDIEKFKKTKCYNAVLKASQKYE